MGSKGRRWVSGPRCLPVTACNCSSAGPVAQQDGGPSGPRNVILFLLICIQQVTGRHTIHSATEKGSRVTDWLRGRRPEGTHSTPVAAPGHLTQRPLYFLSLHTYMHESHPRTLAFSLDAGVEAQVLAHTIQVPCHQLQSEFLSGPM